MKLRTWELDRLVVKQRVIDGVYITFTEKRVLHRDGSVSLKFSNDVRQMETKIPGKLGIMRTINLYGLLPDEPGPEI